MIIIEALQGAALGAVLGYLTDAHGPRKQDYVATIWLSIFGFMIGAAVGVFA